ncbi:hypothetical protein PUN28_008804 [Cardiocondyla obscurior]|uniref:Zinc finger protein n=1 Tax=Cardiocondyla obscurior TaxID=286306 RepID=A0AAW2FU34_9HYME
MSYFGQQSKQQMCANYRKGSCNNAACAVVHSYKYCFNYQNTRCTNANCKYLHITSVAQARYETTGVVTNQLRYEVGRTLQNTNICGDYKTGQCSRENCQRRHIAHRDVLECVVCCDTIVRDTFGAANCGHIFCNTCALKCEGPSQNNNILTVVCPVCQSVGGYEQLH